MRKVKLQLPLMGAAIRKLVLFSAIFTSPALAEKPLSDCPRDELRQGFEQNIAFDDLQDLLVLEGEILKLCAERVSLMNEVVKEDKKLKELLNEETSQSVDTDVLDQIFQDNKTSSKHSFTANNGSTSITPQTPQAHYNWYTMYGYGTNLTVGISNGQGSWLVKKGDTLPGDWKVTTIEAKPAKVVLSKGKETKVLAYQTKGSDISTEALFQ